MYLPFLNLGLGLLTQFLEGLKNQAPVHVLSAVQAAIDAITAHKDDVVSKANLEAQKA
jgi:hypothetical protein